MHGENDGQRLGDPGQLPHRLGQKRPVHECRPVQRDDQVLALRETVVRGRAERVDAVAHRDERVDHRVADVVDPGRAPAFREQVVTRFRRVDEQELRELVGDDPVDLLRHRTVERAEARLHVADREQKLACGQRGGHGRVHVARHEHDVRLGLQQDRLEPLHDRGRLLRVRPGPDAERIFRLPHAELLDEDLGHLAVVVLAGVDEDVFELVATPAELSRDRCDLHHVRPRADHGQDFSAPSHRT
jgi:hypothetical protein